MSFYTTLVFVHIVLALIVFLLILITIYSIFFKIIFLPITSKILAINLLLQTITGALLFFLQDGAELMSYCKNFGVYIGIVFATQFMILKKTRISEFPKRFVIYTSMLSVFIPVVSVLFLLK